LQANNKWIPPTRQCAAGYGIVLTGAIALPFAFASSQPPMWRWVNPCKRPRSRPVDRSPSRVQLRRQWSSHELQQKSGFFGRLSGRHVSLIVWCILHPVPPQERIARRGAGERDNVQHRRRARYRSRLRQAPVSLSEGVEKWLSCRHGWGEGLAACLTVSQPNRCVSQTSMAQTHVGGR